MTITSARKLYGASNNRPARNRTYSPSAQKTIALSDVDGTLVRGSLVLQHAIMLHNKGTISLGDLPNVWLQDKKNETAITALAIAYQQAVTGMRVQDLGVDEFLDSVCNDASSFYSPLQRLIDQRKNGAEVVLVSGSPDFLVENFGNRYGFKAAASKYYTNADGYLTGQLDGMFSAPAKRDFVTSLSLSAQSNVLAFGDTASDVPLFEASSYSVLVAPNEETRSTIGLSVSEIVED
jgi:HAD superfamily phosphoserine phosphatase-like hydrolase